MRCSNTHSRIAQPRVASPWPRAAGGKMRVIGSGYPPAFVAYGGPHYTACGGWRAATRPVAGRYAAWFQGRYAAWFQGRYAANELT